MPTQVVTPAFELPVSLIEAKKHCRVDPDVYDEDPLIESYIRAATEYAEEYTSLRFVTTEMLEVHDCWSSRVSYYELTAGPVQVIKSIKYYNSAGELVTWNASEYVSDLVSVPARIAPSPGCSFPAIQDRINAVETTYLAGYGSAAQVPHNIKVAILMITRYLFDHREDEPLKAQGRFQAPRAADRLLNTYRVYSL